MLRVLGAPMLLPGSNRATRCRNGLSRAFIFGFEVITPNTASTTGPTRPCSTRRRSVRMAPTHLENGAYGSNGARIFCDGEGSTMSPRRFFSPWRYPVRLFVEPHFIAAMAVAKLVENQRTGSPFRICAKGRE